MQRVNEGFSLNQYHARIDGGYHNAAYMLSTDYNFGFRYPLGVSGDYDQAKQYHPANLRRHRSADFTKRHRFDVVYKNPALLSDAARRCDTLIYGIRKK